MTRFNNDTNPSSPMTVCIEKKLTLAGSVQLFECHLLCLHAGIGVLTHIIDREYTVSTVKLHPGDITYALYWVDRPYTLYIWRSNRHQFIYYFNIADSLSLQPDEFIWRDLAVDILVDTDNTAHVLDEDELPPDLSVTLLGYIQSAKDHVLDHYRDIILEANAVLRELGVHA